MTAPSEKAMFHRSPVVESPNHTRPSARNMPLTRDGFSDRTAASAVVTAVRAAPTTELSGRNDLEYRLFCPDIV